MFIPFADRKLQFIDCFNHVRLATPGGPCRLVQSAGRDFETVYPHHEHSISKLEMKAHLLLVNCVDLGSQAMQCNKHVLWLDVVVVQGANIVGFIKCVWYVTTQNRYQCYILRLRIMLQVYNSSLFRSSSWFAVEKSWSHGHGRISFIVYPFPLWSRTKPPKRLLFVVGLSIFFSMTTNWLPPK